MTGGGGPLPGSTGTRPGSVSAIETPFLAKHFRVWVGGDEIGFAQVGPLTSRTEGGDRRVDAVVLRRAITGSSRLWDWHASAGPERGGEDVVIELCDDAGEAVVARWVIVGARPVRWSGPALDANGQEVAMEEIELVADRLEWSSKE